MSISIRSAGGQYEVHHWGAIRLCGPLLRSEYKRRISRCTMQWRSINWKWDVNVFWLYCLFVQNGTHINDLPADVILRILAYAASKDYADVTDADADESPTRYSHLASLLKKTCRSWAEIINNNDKEFRQLQRHAKYICKFVVQPCCSTFECVQSDPVRQFKNPRLVRQTGLATYGNDPCNTRSWTGWMTILIYVH